MCMTGMAAANNPTSSMMRYPDRRSESTSVPYSNSIERRDAMVNITFCFIGYSPCQIFVCLLVRHMTRGGVDEGRCKPLDADDDGADGHPNVEPANLLGVCAPLGLLPLVLHARRIPLLP